MISEIVDRVEWQRPEAEKTFLKRYLKHVQLSLLSLIYFA